MDGRSADITLGHERRISHLEQGQIDQDRRMDSIEGNVAELRRQMSKIFYMQLTTLATILTSVVSGIILLRLKAF